MKQKYQNGSVAYMIENNRDVRQVRVLRGEYEWYIILLERSRGIRIRETRLYPTREAAADVLRRNKRGMYKYV